MLDINTEPASSSPQSFTPSGEFMFFTTSDDSYGTRLWKTDGTSDGTVSVVDASMIGGGGPVELKDVNGTLYFTVAGPSGYRLWKTDGTAAGTMSINGSGSNTFSNPYDLTNVNGTLFFLASGNQLQPEIVRTDGTAAGTKVLFSLPHDLSPTAHLALQRYSLPLGGKGNHGGTETRRRIPGEGTHSQ